MKELRKKVLQNTMKDIQKFKEGNFWPRSEQNLSGSRLQQKALELAKHLWPKRMFHNLSQTANPKCSVIY